MVDIAVLGYGVVGSGVVEVINTNQMSINEKAGEEIRVKKILDIRDFSDDPNKDIITNNADEIFEDESIKIIVETIGGTGAALEYTKRAFLAGKHVVSSNKELVALHGPELLKMAKENNVYYLFEASVGGGIPIIRPLNQCLAANEIYSITAILNGTTNYIITQMKDSGKSFSSALENAKKNGYAEANPIADIEGLDTCRKIAILSSIAFNEFVDCRNIYTEGISKLSLLDFEYALQMNSVIKLIAISEKKNDKIHARVSPAIINNSHPLANVDDVFNAILVRGNAIGEVMFYGRGAGKLPTASAVVADIIDIIKHVDSNGRNIWKRKDYNNIEDIDNMETRFFVRVSAGDIEQAKNLIIREFGEVNFIYLNKKETAKEIAFVTCKDTEKAHKDKFSNLMNSGLIDNIVSSIRILDE
ncbi:MAG TPA: homoserine dehydrogenase [Clostridiaceae bacterium]|nr:homoserine dehydrogenase [Clostridiaceae bacterium]